MKAKIYIYIIELLGRLPLIIRRFLGKLIGILAYCFSHRERQIAQLQIEKFLNRPDAKLITLKMFQFFAINLWETLNLFPILNGKKIKINNQGLWDDLISSPRPIIALTGHTGNWDLLAAYVVKRGAKIITIGRMARGASLQAVLSHLREKYQIKTLWRKNLKDTRELLIESSKGTIVAVLVDQDIKAKGVFSSFFNLPCKTPTALLDLGLKIDARVVSAFMFQETDGSYQLYLKEIPTNQTNQGILDEYHLELEKLIRVYPEQWVWFHKRWRTFQKNDGSNYTMSSKEYLDFLRQI